MSTYSIHFRSAKGEKSIDVPTDKLAEAKEVFENIVELFTQLGDQCEIELVEWVSVPDAGCVSKEPTTISRVHLPF